MALLDLCQYTPVSKVCTLEATYCHFDSHIFICIKYFFRRRRRWEDGIRIDLRETGFGGVDWIRLAQDRDRWRAVVSAVMNLRVLAPRS
jgi:hypothetical protein